MRNDRIEIVDLFTYFAVAARGTALRNHQVGDRYGETIALARARVYEGAVELVSRLEPREAAVEMMRRAAVLHVRNPPLMDFDALSVQYLCARAWQFCAWQINPALPEMQPPW